MMGHCGHHPDIEAALDEMGTCMIFVYRDLRDVAISQTYHIENQDDDRFKHLDKKLYMDMADHEARIKAVIEGVGDYPGIVDRWSLYAPWLKVPWVMGVKYENMRADPKGVASMVVDYVIQRTMLHGGMPPLVAGENYKVAINRAIDQMGTTEYSGSYRKGQPGEWEKEFNIEIMETFHQVGGMDWIERLGY